MNAQTPEWINSAASNSTAQPPPARLKRVAVTSCDSCRLRKLKCNAKDLAPGKKAQRTSNPPQPGTYPHHFMMAPPDAAGAMPHLPHHTYLGGMGAVGQAGSMVNLNNGNPSSSHNGFAALGNGSHFSEQLWPDAQTQAAGPYAPSYAWTSDPTFPDAQAQLPFVEGLSQMTAPATLQSVAVDFTSPSFATLSLPSTLTEPQTGYSREVTYRDLTEILLMRFYGDSTSSAYILPRRDLFRRYFTGSPAPLPEYLLQTLLAASAFLPTTKEPELFAWRPHGWSVAIKSVQTRLRSHVPADLHLIQALLLLGSSWVGDPDDSERAVILEMAFRLSLSIGLNTLNGAGIDPYERSSRIMLFWNMYVLDRMLLIATNRPVILSRIAHDVPAPTAMDANIIALSARDDRSTQSDEHLWIQRQLVAFIALANILEETHSTLHVIRQSAPSTLADVLRHISPVEASLETWCKENKLLLRETAAAHGPLCQNLTESMVAQLHHCQLQLYSAPIRFEVQKASSLPMYFDPSNNKSLTACVESAWYLIQQPLVNHDPSAAMQAILPDSKPVTHFNVANYAVLRAAQFLRLLSCTWAEWRAGRGLQEYTPRNAVEFAVAAQAPYGDVNVLQHQQVMAARQHSFSQPHHSLPPEWKHSPHRNSIPLAPVPEAIPQGPAVQLYQPVPQSEPAAPDFMAALSGYQVSQSTANALPPEPLMPMLSAPSTTSSLTAVSPEQGQTPVSRQGSLSKDDNTGDAGMPFKLPEVQPLARPPSTAKRTGRKEAPKPLNLSVSKNGKSKLAAKRKREVSFIVTDTDEDRATKLVKEDSDKVDANDAPANADDSIETSNGGALLDVLPRTARLDTATLQSFAFPLTPARFLFDATEIDLNCWNWSAQEGQDNRHLEGTSSSGQAPAPTTTSNATEAEAAEEEGTNEYEEEGDWEEEEVDVDQQGQAQLQGASETTYPAGTNLLAPAAGPSSAVQYANDTLAPFNMPFTPSLGNFGATAAMMTPLRTEYMSNFQAAFLPPSSTTFPVNNDQSASSSRALDNFTDGLDLSVFGLKGLDGLDPLQGIFSSLSASDFAGLSNMPSQGGDHSGLGGSAAMEFSTSWLDAFKPTPSSGSGNVQP
ncbi:unnamed protein product [Tilletia laevis]|uniref:Xylanolytic transcriptional activator regulatory domain-containing protein n=1 Tax=Tilletia laevis TaxID=157183 RepID=A0A9N8Q4M0_9BASI|nr:hypothetical protein CF335_g1132 [Tilletia laevis]CAD6890237.1 unnamed protein product [Tilletia caries]CAD6896177.1 unnamed protein product [Tilletia laevis]CAD7067285.1 unnamed protein product [Tilletia caries]